VLVHASTRPEPFGRSIVEGMATGLAVVAITDGGAAELFVDGESALGCPPNDPDALALAIDRLILGPSLRRRLGEAGRRAVLARFDADRLFEAWAPAYPGATPSIGDRPDRNLISPRVPRGRAADTEVSNTHGR
jgi:glycosyltransferase involved in cell wall biosynthesis